MPRIKEQHTHKISTHFKITKKGQKEPNDKSLKAHQ